MDLYDEFMPRLTREHVHAMCHLYDTALLDDWHERLQDALVRVQKLQQMTEANRKRNLIDHLEEMREELWEILHTGHWSEVDDGYRKAYSLVALLKAFALLTIDDCDLAVGILKRFDFKCFFFALRQCCALSTMVSSWVCRYWAMCWRRSRIEYMFSCPR